MPPLIFLYVRNMGQPPRTRSTQQSTVGSSAKESTRSQPRPSGSAKIESGPTCRPETLANPFPAVRKVRYWLLNDTYVDLAVPFEKIGVPFEKSSTGRTLPLSDNEKTQVISELSRCETAIRAGNLDLLELALEICNRCKVAPPVWILPPVIEAINKLLRINPRTRQKRMQREIHQIRWATVHHLHASQKLTWEAAYEAARRDLNHTRARGSEETIRASYKLMNHHPFIKSARQRVVPGELDDFAREQYENRHAISNRLISLEARDATKPKRRRAS